ncbi:MAG TPA: Coenzyme F420 hydrogenase/dehydrogenase, beta subunit C-terminal domain [Allosphingosinicella sp.]|jgi:coenzyme F420-reducing hydrogenase beta subunit
MSSPEPPARFGPRDIVASGLCIGCGGCAGRAKKAGARMEWDKHGLLKPDGPEAFLARGPERFEQTCPFSPRARDEDEIAALLYPDAAHADARVGRWEGAWVGHVEEEEFRASGSSGGMVSWVAAELLRRGLVDAVAHVAPADRDRDGRLFGYRVSRSVAEVQAGAKSRYYPIELSGVIETIRSVPGRYAVIGVPCFIKAVNLLRLEDPLVGERVAFTLGLFCGHMKSARMVDSFALQMGAEPGQVKAIDYRLKDASRPANWYRASLDLADGGNRQQDWWHLVDGDWGSGFFQASACDYCDDVVAETADISFGDAWVEPYSSDGRGTNVVVVRSPVLHAIVGEAQAAGRLGLKAVDAEFVVETQAAGFRHRREGLAWRLARRQRGPIRPRKRVRPGAEGMPLRRRGVYWMRKRISRWSHRVFRLSRRIGQPGLFVRWGKAMLAVYHALTYSRGRLGALIDRVEGWAGRRRAE